MDLQRMEGDLGGIWSFGVKAYRALGVRLRNLGFILEAMKN